MLCPFQKIFPSELLRDDRYFMAHAFNEAVEAWKEDEVPVGAVIVRNGEIIASAHNRTVGTKDPTAHAEMLAITQAANFIGDWRLNDCTLYVTKEPCPMCAGMLINARVKRVVFGAGDPACGGMGGAFDLNQIPGLLWHCEVTSGVLSEQCLEIIRNFFRKRRSEK